LGGHLLIIVRIVEILGVSIFINTWKAGNLAGKRAEGICDAGNVLNKGQGGRHFIIVMVIITIIMIIIIIIISPPLGKSWSMG
jgi:hypothetical protein